MKKTVCIFVTLMVFVACNAQNAGKNLKGMDQNSNTLKTLDSSSVDKLFDRWDKVWGEGHYELIPSCVTEKYIRHDVQGDRTVSRNDYAKEIMQIRKAVPDIQFLIHDRSIDTDKVWIRYTLQYTDPETGKKVNQKGLQVYRIEQDKLAETWLVLQEAGTEWPEVAN